MKKTAQIFTNRHERSQIAGVEFAEPTRISAQKRDEKTVLQNTKWPLIMSFVMHFRVAGSGYSRDMRRR